MGYRRQYLSGVMQHQRERQLLGKGLVQVPVTYPTCPSQCMEAGRHQDQAAPPEPLSKLLWYSLSPCSPPQPLWWRDLCLLTLPTLGCYLVTLMLWYPSTWQQACPLWPVSQERAIQTSLCIREAAPEEKTLYPIIDSVTAAYFNTAGLSHHLSLTM